ncbi:hypothetical protein BP5796_08196 [Coleophoma crateriformis]|uniref:Pyridoxamine 5'-phosphate oxidase N-terminal domain-containing protein n=1 Tax=Coleophoma crateriformis TaxID=565419 RepID=A0A3D8RDR1_9HELO|nr:hypothetical protein BP5796_08196 [Coleophoma crateriformis]
MPKFYDHIPDNLAQWAMAQPLFYTASAPISGQHINISPKGLPSSTFTIFTPNSCAYIDATGSGSETISHIYENGRVTLMFCSFASSPRIMRFFCKGSVIEWDSPLFDTYLTKMNKAKVDGARAVILLDVWKVQTSCGYGVPRLAKTIKGDPEKHPEDSFEDRETLGHWAGKQVEKGEMQRYQMENNAWSLDGVPGLRTARRDLGERLWWTDLTAGLNRILQQREALYFGICLGVLLTWATRFGVVVLAS